MEYPETIQISSKYLYCEKLIHMKSGIKKVLYSIMYRLLFLIGGEGFSSREFNPGTLFRYFFEQKILRINPHVPWPVHRTSQIKAPEKIEKGNRNPGMSLGCYIDGRNGIKFGKNVWIGPRVSIISMEHDL